MNNYLVIIYCLIITFICSCSSKKQDYSLFERLDERLPNYSSENNSRKPIPKYGYDRNLPIHKYGNTENYNTIDYPTYIPEADNPIYPTSQENIGSYKYQYPEKYPTYNPEADNPSYSTQTNNNFNDRVYQEFYPIYDPEADNPSYNTQSTQGFDNKVYQDFYPTYDQEADNPVAAPASDSLFDKPSFDSPMFKN